MPRQRLQSRCERGSDVGLLHAALLVPVAAAQSAVYPAGPPWRPVPGAEFNGRDLRQELKNKTTDTFTVTSVATCSGSPVAKRMSVPFRDLLRNADITVGSLSVNRPLVWVPLRTHQKDLAAPIPLAVGDPAGVAESLG